MAQQRIYKQPNRGRKDDSAGGGGYVEPPPSPGFSEGPEYTPGLRAAGSRGVSESAGQTLGNIDEVLSQAGSDNMGQRGIPQSIARAARNRRAAVGRSQSERNGYSTTRRTPQDKADAIASNALNSRGEPSGSISDALSEASRDNMDRRSQSERGMRSARRTPEEAGRALTGGALGAAEAGVQGESQGGEDDAHSSLIGGIYNRAGVNPEGVGEGKNRLAVFLKGVSRRRKLLAGGGVGGIVGLFVAIAVISPIYRVPALMTDLEGKVGEQVANIVEHRAERIVIDYLIAKAGGNPTDYVITGSPISSIWRTMESRRIEKAIAAKTGITFEKGADGVVRVIHDGRPLGPGRNYEEVLAIIARGTVESKADFKAIIKYSNVVAALRMHKAGIEARSFKERFLKRRFGVPQPTKEEKNDKTKTSAEKAAKELETLTQTQIEQGVASSLGELGNAFDCGMGGKNCDEFKKLDPNAEVPDPNSDVAKRQLANGTAEKFNEEVQSAAGEAKDEAKKDRTGGFVNRLIEKLLTKLVGAVVAKTLAGLIPFVGPIDTLATIQHGIGEVFANSLAYRIPVMLKENIYGAIYASWAGYGDQTKAGKMSLTMLSALSQQLGGSEKALTHHLVYGGKNVGVPVKPKVGSNKYDNVGKFIDEVYNNLGVRIAVRGPLELWYYTVGALIRISGDLLGDVKDYLFRVSGFQDLVDRTMKELFGENWQVELGKFAVKAVLTIYGIVVDPLARGAQMYNNIVTGAAVALNYHCHFFLGCRTLTDQEAVVSGMDLQKQADEEMAMTSIKDRLFSINLPHSLAGSLLRAAPADPRPDTIISSLFAQVAKLPSTILGVFSPKTRALSYVDLGAATGTQWWGSLPSDLTKPTAPELRHQVGTTVTCPRVDPTKEFNACDADQTVLRDMACQWEDCQDFQDNSGTNVSAGNGTCTDTDSVGCAKALLAIADAPNPQLAFGDCWDAAHNKYDCAPVRHDLEIVAGGGTIQNADSCNNAVTIHPKLLYALYQATQKFKVTVDSFVTTHGGECSANRYHPQGRAMDIWYINGVRTQSSRANPAPYNQAFAEYIAQYLPPNDGEILQAVKCFPFDEGNPKKWPGLSVNGDTCDHIHVSVGSVKP